MYKTCTTLSPQRYGKGGGGRKKEKKKERVSRQVEFIDILGYCTSARPYYSANAGE